MQSQIISTEKGLAVIIPDELLTVAGFKEGDVVNLYAHRDWIEVADSSKPHYDIEEVVASITDEQIHGEIDWGPPVGREVW